MKEQGYGAGYAYDHDAEDGFSGQNYFPRRHGARTSTSRSNAASNAT
jgi:replication-associated recombination protein RarA